MDMPIRIQRRLFHFKLNVIVEIRLLAKFDYCTIIIQHIPNSLTWCMEPYITSITLQALTIICDWGGTFTSYFFLDSFLKNNSRDLCSEASDANRKEMVGRLVSHKISVVSKKRNYEK